MTDTTDPQTAVFVTMLGEFPTAVSATLEAAQQQALDGETMFQEPGKYEHRWDDKQRPGEVWRLLGRRALPERRFSATGRTVHALAASNVQLQPASAPSVPADRAALSAKLWAVAEHHIVAEWICCEPLEPRHTLCAKGYAALGMARTLLVDGDPEKAWNPEAPLLNAVLAELERLRRERDLAIAHDRQPYPTAWAYEQACAALRTHRGRADALEQEVRRLGLMVDEYGAGASALTDKLKRARDMHRETCIAAKGDVSPTAFTCGMCEVLDAPAAAVLPPDGRAASYRLAADAIESMQGYPHLILPEEIVEGLRLLAAGMQPEPGSPAYSRRLAAGERDEQQAQQDGCPHGCDTSICPCLACEAAEEQQSDTETLPSIHANDVQGFCPACGHGVLMLGEGGHVVCTLMDCPRPEAADELLHQGAAPVAVQPPADTGEEARGDFEAGLPSETGPKGSSKATPIHVRPGPDDNGVSPCCGRPPFEFRGERLTRDPAAVTCPTSPAVVAELGKEA